MKARTEAEVKAYADGYKACYKEFCQCLKNNTAEQAIKKMGVFVVVVNNCVEVAEQTEPSSSEKPNNSTISKMEQVEDEPQTDCAWK